MNTVAEKDIKKNGSSKKNINPYGKITDQVRVLDNGYYELVILLRSDIASQDANDFMKKLMSIVSEENGLNKKIEYWGLRELAYKIKKSKKAHYYCLNFQSKNSLLAKLEKELKISSSVIRFLILRLTDFDADDSCMIRNLNKDIEDGIIVHDQKYIIKLPL